MREEGKRHEQREKGGSQEVAVLLCQFIPLMLLAVETRCRQQKRVGGRGGEGVLC